MDSYLLNPNWSLDAIDVLLIGAGGTGSECLDALTRLHLSLLAVGHPHGLNVTVADDDRVEAHNICRQRFAPMDVGKHKALVLVDRINRCYGLKWQAFPQRVDVDSDCFGKFDVVIGATDSGSFRSELGKLSSGNPFDRHEVLWLDFGNGSVSGQCVLGHLFPGESECILPNIYDLYPNIADELDQGPSCSAAESLRRQGPFINAALVRPGINLLWTLLTEGKLDRHGFHMNLKDLSLSPLMIDPEVWAFYGLKVA